MARHNSVSGEAWLTSGERDVCGMMPAARALSGEELGKASPGVLLKSHALPGTSALDIFGDADADADADELQQEGIPWGN